MHILGTLRYLCSSSGPLIGVWTFSLESLVIASLENAPVFQVGLLKWLLKTFLLLSLVVLWEMPSFHFFKTDSFNF
jgi:hypothetical protein